MNIENFKLDIDNESVHIYIDNGEDKDVISICYWNIDEVEEDASIAFVIANAIDAFHKFPDKLIDSLT